VPTEIVEATVHVGGANDDNHNSTNNMGPPPARPSENRGQGSNKALVESLLEKNSSASIAQFGREKQNLPTVVTDIMNAHGNSLQTFGRAPLPSLASHLAPDATKLMKDKPSLPLLPKRELHLAHKENPSFQAISFHVNQGTYANQVNQILPPMQQPKQEQPTMLGGPNIYALQTTHSQNNSYNQDNSYISYPSNDFNVNTTHYVANINYQNYYLDHNNHANNLRLAPDLVSHHKGNVPAIFHSENQDSSYPVLPPRNIKPNLKLVTKTTVSRPDITYRNERIEKQRQMMSEGGSLFVTSPRSFLMGWKSEEVSTTRAQ
jgi:hypothetical protein